MKKAGAAVPSANRITLLRDADGDGVAEISTAFIEGLNSPFGMALVGNELCTSRTPMAIVKFPYTPGATQAHRRRHEGHRSAGRRRAIITGPRTSSRAATARSSTRRWARTATSPRTAWTRRKAAPRSGKSMCAAARSACSPRACAIRTAWRGSRRTGTLWTVANERDELGNDLVPDYLTSVQRRRLLRLAVQLLRHARGRARGAAAAGSGRAGRSRPTTRSARTSRRSASRLREKTALPDAVRERHVHRPARLVESQAARGLQGGVRAVRERQARGPAGRRAHRLRERRRRGVRPPGGRGDRRRGALLVADDVGNVIWRTTAR